MYAIIFTSLGNLSLTDHQAILQQGIMSSLHCARVLPDQPVIRLPYLLRLPSVPRECYWGRCRDLLDLNRPKAGPSHRQTEQAAEESVRDLHR